MKNRCSNPNLANYYRYGGKGITVCSEWHDFIPFSAWALANGYTDLLTIDRIDPSLDYTPDNCRFATKTMQSRNIKLKVGKSGYKGVRIQGIKYTPRVKVDYVEIKLGSYYSGLKAAFVRDTYIKENNTGHTLSLTEEEYHEYSVHN